MMINEERVSIPCGELRLEGLLRMAVGDRSVVISHPNPLMGGSMQNNVVESLVMAFYGKGYTTLRYNFRGAGRSQGIHANGEGEMDDLDAAIAYLKTRGFRSITLAGYSFGAWITAKYIQNQQHSGRVILIAPPVSVYTFPEEKITGKVDLIVSGEKDPFCLTKDIEGFAGKIKAKVEIMPRTDHFFVGKEEIIEEIIRENIS